MPKPLTRKTNKSPRRPAIRLLIADDFRMETGGKTTAVGLYTDFVVVANLLAGAPEPSASTPLVIPNLSALVTVSGLVGAHQIELEYVDPLLDAKPLAWPGREIEFPNATMSGNLLVRFQPFVAGGFGKKQVVVMLDGERTEFEFELRRGEVSSDAVPASPVVSSASSKSNVARTRRKGSRTPG